MYSLSFAHAFQIEPLHWVKDGGQMSEFEVKGLPPVFIPMERKNMRKKESREHSLVLGHHPSLCPGEEGPREANRG